MAVLRGPWAGNPRPRSQRGDSLLELLVAVLVIGVGALGVAKLQMQSAQSNRIALQVSMATSLAEDMLERLRANSSANYAGVGFGDPPPTFVDCRGRTCTSAEMEAFDVVLWKCALGRWREQPPCAAARTAGLLAAPQLQPSLPDGDGAVTSDASGLVTATVRWQGQGEVALSTQR